jgi:hypothetical protein
MKKQMAFVLAFLLAFSPVLFAGVEVQDDGVKVGRVEKLSFTGSTITKAGSTATVVIDGTICADGTIAAPTLTGVVTATGGIFAGASPLVFEGATPDSYETTIAVTDPTADVTITLPKKTGTALVLANAGTDEVSLVMEGATADDSETTLAFTDPTADITYTFPDAGTGTYAVMSSTLATNAPAIANSVTGGTSQLIFEGATADAHEAIIDAADATADTIFRLPVAAAATYSLMSSTLATNAADIANSVYGVSNGLTFEGATANAYETNITPVDPTADRTVTLPNASGTVFLASAATALTPGAAVALTVGTGNQLFTDTITTDNQDQTITFSAGGSAGEVVTIIFVTDGAGSADEVITFHGTLARTTGTLTLANAAASRYVIQFVSDGTKWNEVSRTAVQAA